MDRLIRQKINKETWDLNDTLGQMDLTDIYRAFHPKAVRHTFFSSVQGTFSRIDHMLGHIASLSEFKKTEIKSNIDIFSNYKAIKLEINYKKKTWKDTDRWKLNNMLLSNQCITKEIKEEIFKCLKINA